MPCLRSFPLLQEDHALSGTRLQMHKQTFAPALHSVLNPCRICLTGFFYVEGAFHNDMRAPGAADLSFPIRTFCHQQGLQPPALPVVRCLSHPHFCSQGDIMIPTQSSGCGLRERPVKEQGGLAARPPAATAQALH